MNNIIDERTEEKEARFINDRNANRSVLYRTDDQE